MLGLIAGVLAKTLLRQSEIGVIATILIGIGGTLPGGWAASKCFYIDTAAGFFDLSTWIIAVIGSVVLRLTFHGITSGSRRSSLFRARR